MDKYFGNSELLQNTLLPYFCDEEPLKLINKLFYKLNYEKYNTHIQPHGIDETYYENIKILKIRKNCKNSKLHGLYEKWYENGKLDMRCRYIDGLHNGLYESWYENRQLFCKFYYLDDKINGLYERWHVNGQPYIKSNYKDGKLDGLYEEWFDTVEVRYKIIYENGVSIKVL
jgi:antitoxin component YwqK of YwqJK toxin-antitoxin module